MEALRLSTQPIPGRQWQRPQKVPPKGKLRTKTPIRHQRGTLHELQPLKGDAAGANTWKYTSSVKRMQVDRPTGNTCVFSLLRITYERDPGVLCLVRTQLRRVF